MTESDSSPLSEAAAVPNAAPVVDEYLLEVYRQACENARMYATSRFSNLSAFLTYVSLLTAGLAFLLSGLADSSGPLVPAACLTIGFMGLIVSVLFFALEIRHHHWWKFYEDRGVKRFEKLMGHTQYPDPNTSFNARDFVQASPLRIGATNATYGIYIASTGFFGLVVAFAVALLVVRS